MVSNYIIWPRELNEEGFSFFSALNTILGETKVSPLSVFRHCETGFFDFPQKFPLERFDVLQQWMLKNPKGSPFQRANSVQLLGFSGTVKEFT